MSVIQSTDRVLVTGGTGLIGTNLCNRLRGMGFEVLAAGSKHDLRIPDAAKKLFDDFRPNVVFHLAARVGGIFANVNYKADFYSDNVLINTHVVNECVRHGIRYVFAMGTGCAYPKRLEKNVLHENDFLDGIPEVTNDAYAYAKRGLLVHLSALHEAKVLDYVYCLPANIYGPHDNFHPQHSHVVPGLIRRFCDTVDQNGKSVKIWGDGSAARDFLYIDDCIDAMVRMTEKEATGVFNVATGKLTTIRELATTIKEASGFKGEIQYDTSLPAGQMQRVFDTTKMAKLGWAPKTDLATGIRETISWFRASAGNYRER